MQLGLVPREVAGEGRRLRELPKDLQDVGVVGCDRNPRIERLDGKDRRLGEHWPKIDLGVSWTAPEPPVSDASIITSSQVRSFREVRCNLMNEEDAVLGL